MAKDCRVAPRMVNPVNARNPTTTPRACYKRGGTDHFKVVCPRLNQAQRPGGNRPGSWRNNVISKQVERANYVGSRGGSPETRNIRVLDELIVVGVMKHCISLESNIGIGGLGNKEGYSVYVRLKAAARVVKKLCRKRRKPLEFSVGDHVLLKVLPWKGVVRFGKKYKLTPRFVVPFEIIESVSSVAYRLRLPEEQNGVHDTFHVSNLKKCLADPTLQVPLDEIQVDAKLNNIEEPVEILELEFKKLKRSRIAIVKVWWNSKRVLKSCGSVKIK
ncbi:hypothetical protein Tco_0890009 [Tanacetum coccineum]